MDGRLRRHSQGRPVLAATTTTTTLALTPKAAEYIHGEHGEAADLPVRGSSRESVAKRPESFWKWLRAGLP